MERYVLSCFSILVTGTDLSREGTIVPPFGGCPGLVRNPMIPGSTRKAERGYSSVLCSTFSPLTSCYAVRRSHLAIYKDNKECEASLGPEHDARRVEEYGYRSLRFLSKDFLDPVIAPNVSIIELL